jgi:hypothetical protein
MVLGACNGDKTENVSFIGNKSIKLPLPKVTQAT